MGKRLLFILTLVILSFGSSSLKLAIAGEKNPNLRFYPNPVINTLNIEVMLPQSSFSAQVEVKVKNLLGKEMLEPRKFEFTGLSKDLNINLQDLPAGVYLIEVLTVSDGVSYKQTKKINKN